MKTELIIVTKITNITNYICGEKIVMWRNFGRFCHNLRAFMWRKIEPKKYICGEKMTHMKSAFKSKNVLSQHLKTTENEEDLIT